METPASSERFRAALPGSGGGRVLSLRHADIATEPVDAVVNAANSGLVLGGGVAGAILRRGGQVIQDECDRLGKIAIGSAAVTGAGALPAKAVIHAVGPVWRANAPDENDRLLASATTAALEIARQRAFESIAFPAVSSGIFGFPKDRCARVMVGAVLAWAEANPNDPPRDIRFTLIDAPTVAFFEAELEERFGAGHAAASPAPDPAS